MCDLDAAGGMLLGNPHGLPHRVGLRAWTHGGRPASAGGTLDAIRKTFEAGTPRPTRLSGGLRRHVARTHYLNRFASLFHALRPLRFVLDTASAPLSHYVAELTAATNCEILPPRPIAPLAGKAAGPPAAHASEEAMRQRRLAWLVERVPAAEADFGIWIDGDGERVTVVDEQANLVDNSNLLAAIARYELHGQAGAIVVAEPATLPACLVGVEAAGIGSCLATGQDREAMFTALGTPGAALGGGPSGRFWFPGPPWTPDGLALLGWLLSVLSRGDQPLSEVLAAGESLDRASAATRS